LCLQPVPAKQRVTGQEILNFVTFNACKRESHLEIKRYGAAVPVWRAEAVEVTILLYAIH